MKLSVIIPTYRRTGLLQKCLDALQQQDFDTTAFEVIVVTDGPDSETCESVKHYAAFNIRCISLPVKKGPAAARNAGWKAAKAPLVVFTDDDCIPSPQWLTSYWQAYTKATPGLCAFTGKVNVPLPETQPTDYEQNVAQLAVAEFITANCACSVNVLQDIGGFDEGFTMAYREDSDLHFKLLAHGIDIIHLPQAVVCHPVRPARWGVSLKEQRKSRFNALLYKKHPALYKEKIGVQPLWNYYSILTFFMLMLTGWFMKVYSVAAIAGMIWLLLVLEFTIKRLKHTSKTAPHVLEMLFTSMLIPFLSIYWTLYGSVKYKVWLL